ncbi:MAG: hypothetical protein HYZ73_08360 [Elusimicrobia bacterium]|nr:hypothetical protein [Elusimicrobiota bacterium]
MTFLGIPLIGVVGKLIFWITNRLAAWSGSIWLWRLGRRTQRRRYYIWAVLLNLSLWGLLLGVFWWLALRARGKV